MAFTNKIVFTVVNVLMLILVPIHQIEGFPDGAPISACGSMTPGHGPGAQKSKSPFETVVSDKMGKINSPVTLELRPSPSAGGKRFKGYLVLAFDVNDNSKPIGTFANPNGGKLINCDVGMKNVATHSDNSAKISVKLEWNPPSNYSGKIIFRTTFVQNFMTFWIKTESEVISFIPTTETTASATTVPVTEESPRSSTPSESVKPTANLAVNVFLSRLSRLINKLRLRLLQASDF